MTGENALPELVDIRRSIGASMAAHRRHLALGACHQKSNRKICAGAVRLSVKRGNAATLTWSLIHADLVSINQERETNRLVAGKAWRYGAAFGASTYSFSHHLIHVVPGRKSSL